MNEEIEFAKQLYSDLIPYDDPEYEQKLQQCAEAYVEILNNTSQEEIDNKVRLSSEDDLPW